MSARAGRGPGINLTDPRVLAELGTLGHHGHRALALLDKMSRATTHKQARHLRRSAQRAARRALEDQ